MKTDTPSVDRRSLLLQAGSLLLIGCGGGGNGAPSNPAPTPAPTPVCLSTLVPAYFYKSAPWAQLTASGPSTVVIANASNGPGSKLDAQYKAWIDAVRSTGNRVKGYVYTLYGQRSTAAVLADMDAWTQLYGINDFFVDEVSVKAIDVAYYANLLATASAANPNRRFMLNPGAPPDPAYFSLLPAIEVLVFENPWTSYSNTSLPAALDAFASQCWIMGLSASQADMLQIAAVARSRRFAGFFATDVTFTAGLPTYWDAEKTLAVCA